MTREFWTNRWILGGICFLILFAGLCYLWYHYTTAPYKEQAASDEELLHQLETEKRQTNNAAEIVSQRTPAESTPTAEKPKEIGTTVAETNISTDKTSETITTAAPKTDSTEEVKVSPYGFGPYPEVPADYPSTVAWNRDMSGYPEELRPEAELLSRVLVKLWTEGEKNFRGGSTHNGKTYPHYHNTVYVRFAEYREPDGKVVRYAARGKSGPDVVYTEADLLDPPPHLRILDLDSSGIDPYQYLDLP